MHCHVKKPDWGQAISSNVVGPNADHWSILVSRLAVKKRRQNGQMICVWIHDIIICTLIRAVV